MKLDLNVLKVGIIKNVRNSQELIDEAEILFNHGKYARTYVLSHLAIEESSKCAMLLKVIAFKIWEEEIDLKVVRKRYSNHKEKILNFELINILNNENINTKINLDNQIESLNISKNNSLYVSWSNENNFVLPSEIFSREDVEEKFQIALNYVKLFTSISVALINDENKIYDKIKASKSNKFISEIIDNEKARKSK